MGASQHDLHPASKGGAGDDSRRKLQWLLWQKERETLSAMRLSLNARPPSVCSETRTGLVGRACSYSSCELELELDLREGCTNADPLNYCKLFLFQTIPTFELLDFFQRYDVGRPATEHGSLTVAHWPFDARVAFPVLETNTGRRGQRKLL